MMRHKVFPVALALLTVLVSGCEERVGAADPSGSRTATAKRGLPSSMIALGDSLSVGFAACVVPAPCPSKSWTTGDDQPRSHYRRIVEANPAMRGNARNVAATGARSADLPAQARTAVTKPADYVTILIGANDACHGQIGEMTDVRKFRSNVDDALEIIHRAMPNARVLMVSIPDIYRLWEVGHTDRVATRIWSFGVCPALLANATSTAAADVSRRKTFRQRVTDYNSQLEGACREYGRRCRTDGGAAFGFRFTLDLLCAVDFFHPDVNGQAKIADVTYPGKFSW